MPPPLMQKAVAPKLFASRTSCSASIFGSSPSRRLMSSTRFARCHQSVDEALVPLSSCTPSSMKRSSLRQPLNRQRFLAQPHALPPAAFEEVRLERFARTRLELFLACLGIEHVRRRLVTDRDHRQRRVFRRNVECGTRFSGVVATHLMNREAQRSALKREAHAGSAGIVLSVSIRFAAVPENAAGAREQEQRNVLHPFLVVLREAVVR